MGLQPSLWGWRQFREQLARAFQQEISQDQNKKSMEWRDRLASRPGGLPHGERDSTNAAAGCERSSGTQMRLCGNGRGTGWFLFDLWTCGNVAKDRQIRFYWISLNPSSEMCSQHSWGRQTARLLERGARWTVLLVPVTCSPICLGTN